MTTRGINDITGTVHDAKHDGVGLVQDCGIQSNQTLFLDPTDEPTTCKRCLRRKPVTVKAPRPVAASTGGGSAWGVFNATGKMVTFRTTKRDALAAIQRIGDATLTAKRI